LRHPVQHHSAEDFVRLHSFERNDVSVSGAKGIDKDGIRKHVTIERVVEFARNDHN